MLLASAVAFFPLLLLLSAALTSVLSHHAPYPCEAIFGETVLADCK